MSWWAVAMALLGYALGRLHGAARRPLTRLDLTALAVSREHRGRLNRRREEDAMRVPGSAGPQ